MKFSAPSWAALLFLLPLTPYASPFYREPVKGDVSQITENEIMVLFTDKGFRTEAEYQGILQSFSPDYPLEVIEKRIRRMGEPYNFFDLPVYERYIDEITNLGAKLRTVSNWLNAASFYIDRSLLPKIAELPFVYDIKPVGIKKLELPEAEKADVPDTVIYGLSYRQIAMLGVHKAHKRGIFGSNVKIGLLDTGLKRRRKDDRDTTVHSAVVNIRVLKEHDFLAGSDFFQAKRATRFAPEITGLKNFCHIEDPKLGEIYLNLGRDTSPILFFIADTVYLNLPPRRAVFHSVFSADTWSRPVMISYHLPHTVFHNLSLTNDNFWRTLVAFEGTEPDERPGSIYFGYFENGALRPLQAVERGKRPFLFSQGNNIYLVFRESDSVVKIKTAIASPDSITWQPTRTIASLREEIKELAGVSTGGKVEVFALGLKTGKVYHFHSEDTGRTFTEKPSPFSANVAKIKAYATADTTLLFAKIYSPPPLISLSYKTYLAGNWSEEKRIIENLPRLGNFSFLKKDTSYLVVEKNGRIELYQSEKRESWRMRAIDTAGFLYDPNIFSHKGDLFLLYARQGDDNTDYEPEEDFADQPYHGTRMASLIAGYSRGYLIGVAPAAQLIVAKTEKLVAKTGMNYELIVEEDNWVKGLEWAESQGADIISSSLGYRGWYSDRDFDGKTCITSIAAGIAARRGLIVVTAMGNRGRDSITHPWPRPYLVAPGDADGILTIGGVKLDSTPWKGSGTGPTPDGRIKPDLVALSYNAIVARPYADGRYDYSIGTSAATALVAGLCALALEAHPNWNSDSIRKALFATASRSVPDYVFGYGIPNIDSLLKVYPTPLRPYKRDEIGDIYPQPFIIGKSEKVYFPLHLANLSRIKIRIYDLRGRLVWESKNEKDGRLPPGRYITKEELEDIGAFWDGRDKKGELVSSGLYFVHLHTGFGNSVKKFALLR